MKKFLGILLIIAGTLFGLYVGIYICLYEGIINIIDFIRNPSNYSTGFVVWNGIKVLLSETFGGIPLYLSWVLGMCLIGSNKY
jgi:uncharacterized membrane protein